MDLLDSLQSFLHKNPDALPFRKSERFTSLGPTFSMAGMGIGGICQSLRWPILLILPVASPVPTGGRVGHLDLKQIAEKSPLLVTSGSVSGGSVGRVEVFILAAFQSHLIPGLTLSEG